MYAIEPRITVRIEYGRSLRGADVTIPWNVLRYLDLHSERRLTPEGEVVYCLTRTVDREVRHVAASQFDAGMAA
jgi:hypothetical protein